MNTKIKTSIYVGEGLVGYKLIGYVPKTVLLGNYNGLAVGCAVALAGALAPQKMYANHILAVGLGAVANEILSLVGMS